MARPKGVTERCAAAQRRRRGSAFCTRRNPAGSFRCGNTSQALRASSPQGEPSLSRTRPQSLSLRRGGTRSVTERCAAQRAAARQRPLHTPKPCGKPSVRQHLSSGAGWRILRGFAPRNLGLRRHSKNSSIRRFAPAPLEGSLPSQASGPVRSAVVRCTRAAASRPYGSPLPLFFAASLAISS